MRHDQNFKHLVLDYPRQALLLFAIEEETEPRRFSIHRLAHYCLDLSRLKYLDFIDIYSGLDDNERMRHQHEYPREAETMTGFAERFRQEGRQEGRREGEALRLPRLLQLKFGDLPEPVRRRIESADAQTLPAWSERVLTATKIDDVVP